MTELIVYRAHRPQWSHAPKSGEGAKRHGGRWNLKGTPALYFSFNPMPAIAESTKGLFFRPVTLVQYRITGGKIGDYRDAGFRASEGLPDDLMGVNWQDKRHKSTGAPSQNAAAALASRGWHGMTYPSAESDGVNLVLWAWDEPGCPILEVQDKDNDLPKNRDSWR